MPARLRSVIVAHQAPKRGAMDELIVVHWEDPTGVQWRGPLYRKAMLCENHLLNYFSVVVKFFDDILSYVFA